MNIKMGATIVAAGMLLVGCGGDKPNTFTVSGHVIGTVGTPAVDIKPGTSCRFTDGTVSVGDPVNISGANGTTLAIGKLTAASVANGPACSFAFTASGVRGGEAGYQITVGSSYKLLSVTEDELKGDVMLDVRGPSDVLRGRTDPIKLTIQK